MKTIEELKKAIPVSIKQDLYVKEVNGNNILAYFPNQVMVVMTKRLFNANPALVTPDMPVARIIRMCEKLEAEGKLSADISGVTVTSKGSKNETKAVVTANIGGEEAEVKNVVVTPVVPDDQPAEAKAEAKPTKQVNPLAFVCKVAVDEARGSDFAWCLSRGQMTRVSMVAAQRFGLDKDATTQLMDTFLNRFTKRYGRTTLISPELLAWRYNECHFFITTGRGVFNYVVKKNGDGGDIYPADNNFVIRGEGRHFTNNWFGDMDGTMKEFFFSNLLLKEVK